jgi:S-adenosyl-L-methionine hydrolase (adenosine-forming)
MMAIQNRLITLTSDFGPSYYVGEMKGVIKKVNEKADIIDVTHSVARHSIVEGAFILSRIWRYFPKNAIHVAVVDPGVGTNRKAVAVETDECAFMGPDNGIIRWALKGQDIVRAVELDAAKVQVLAGLKEMSSTFHGRDVFAPAAALLSRGTDLDFLGARIDDIEPLPLKENAVVHVDTFGNIITTAVCDIRPGAKVTVTHGGIRYDALAVRTFSDAPPGTLIVLLGSHGLLEVDVNLADASQLLQAKVGDEIRVENAR